MVIETFLDIVFSVVEYFLAMIPKTEIVIENLNMKPFLDIIGSVLYFFPMGTVKYILAAAFSLIVTRIVIALLKTIIEIIPFV